MSYLIPITLNVLSTDLGITSKHYNFNITSQGFISIQVIKSQLNKEISQYKVIGYNIYTEFNFFSDHAINVTNNCSPFWLSMASPSPWHLSTIGCQAIPSSLISVGITKYSITSQLVDPSGNLYNYTTALPPTLTFLVAFGNNLVISSFQTLKT